MWFLSYEHIHGFKSILGIKEEDVSNAGERDGRVGCIGCGLNGGEGEGGHYKWHINMDISANICPTVVIILIFESAELAEDNCDKQVSDFRRNMSASEWNG